MTEVSSVLDGLADEPDPCAWWPDCEVEERSGEVLHVETRRRGERVLRDWPA